MALPFTLGDAVDLTDVAIQKIWLKSSDVEKETYYDKYAHVEKGVSDLYLKDSSITGLGQAARIPEQAIIIGEAPVQGYDKTYTQVEFGKLMSVTKQMWKFGIKKRDLESIVQELRAACLRHREQFVGDLLDNSFSTSFTKTDDGGSYTFSNAGGNSAALISASQTREDGGTNWNNRVTDGTTVNMDFDYDAIKAAHRTASLIRDGKGNLMNVNLDTLIVRKGHANHFRAMEILGAIRAGGRASLPGSADNDAAGTPAFKVIATPWISTNTAYWWMFDSSMKGPKYGLQLKESQPVMLEGPNVVFKTGEIQYKATNMFDLGHNDARNIVGSKNTNAA